MAKTLYLLLSALSSAVLLNADISSNELPLPQIDESLTQALTEAERILKETILSNAVISIVQHGASAIPLNDISLEVDNIALVQMTNLSLRSSPFHMTAAIPNLRLMNLDLQANISLLEVTGNYTVSIEIMNRTSRAMITSDKGIINLTFHNLEISGLAGLNLNGNNLHVHTVDLQYMPNLVVLRIHYKDAQGIPRITEEINTSAQGTVEEPVHKHLAERLNLLVREDLNRILNNVTIPQLMGNNQKTEIRFRTNTNNQIGNLNDFIDIILNTTKENVTDKISIPNLEKSFEKKMGFIRIRGSFIADDGWLKDLKTIYRTADVTLRRMNNNSIEVNAILGLRTLEFGYERYSAKLLRVGPSGTLTAAVGRNSVSFRGRVGYSGCNCTVTLEDLRVRHLDNIELRLTGLSLFNWILSKIGTSVVNRSKSNIIRAIEETIGNKIRNKLEDFDCRQFFPEPAVRSVHPVVDNKV